MRSLIMFTLKEFRESYRSGKILFLGILFVVFGIILVAVIAGLSFALDTGMNESFISPLTINGKEISSGEFSFMYHYELLSEGVDLFAADTEKMLASPYLDDENFATYRDYFRFVTAQDFQKMEILYDDATSNGFEIEKAHYIGLSHRSLFNDY